MVVFASARLSRTDFLEGRLAELGQAQKNPPQKNPQNVATSSLE
jgi:hypothetical protein